MTIWMRWSAASCDSLLRAKQQSNWLRRWWPINQRPCATSLNSSAARGSQREMFLSISAPGWVTCRCIVAACTQARAVGIEIEPSYVDRARQCAEALNLDNAVIFCARRARGRSFARNYLLFVHAIPWGDSSRSVRPTAACSRLHAKFESAHSARAHRSLTPRPGYVRLSGIGPHLRISLTNTGATECSLSVRSKNQHTVRERADQRVRMVFCQWRRSSLSWAGRGLAHRLSGQCEKFFVFVHAEILRAEQYLELSLRSGPAHTATARMPQSATLGALRNCSAAANLPPPPGAPQLPVSS